jgi:predicted transcriptional regulator
MSKEREKSVVLSSFRLPEKLVQRIDAIAEKEHRPRTNMLYVLLLEALEAREKAEGRKK